jgi:ankyrin repeat protein
VKSLDVNAKDYHGNTSLHWAAKDGWALGNIKWLVESGNADVDSLNNDGSSPQDIAESENHLTYVIYAYFSSLKT